MKKLALAVGLALSLSPALADSPKLDPSLQETWKKFNEAFNRADPKEVASYWAEDGTLVNPVGEMGTGREGVATAYGKDADTILKGATSTFTVLSARKLRADLTFLDLEHDIQGFKFPDGTSGPMKLHLVVLAQKKGKSWKWLDARPYAFLKGPPAK